MKKTKPSLQPRFPEDEKRYSWLPILLDAYGVIDRGIDFAVRQEEKSRGARLACRKGCDICCRFQKDIPIYPLEMVGIYWYAVEKLSGQARSTLKAQLAEYRGGLCCPFLIDSACSIHPLRPAGCRQFNVFGNVCVEGEDPFFTRRDDVLQPIRSYTDHAFTIMLPFYGVTDEKTQAEVIRTGLIHSKARVLQSLDWSELGRRMEEFDSKVTA